MPAVVLRGDARSLPLPDGSVDLIVTSPPYYELRSYTDNGQHYDGQIGDEPTPGDYISALLECTREWMRVLKPAGSMWVNLGDKYARTGGVDKKERGGKGDVGNRKAGRQVQRGAEGIPDKSLIGLPWRYAIGCIDRLGLILRAEVIWDKPNGLPESVTDRVRRSHEQWFHLTRQGRYYSAVEEIRTPAVRDGARASGKRYGGEIPGVARRHQGLAAQPNHPLGSLPGSVWTIPSEPLTVPDWLGVDHFAAFPTEWPRRIIRGWSPPGICTVCGEGRRPVPQGVGVDMARPEARRALALVEQHGLTDEHIAAVRAVGLSDTGHSAATQNGTGKNTDAVYVLADEARRVLGGYAREFLAERPTRLCYVCACTPCTKHPGTPGVSGEHYSDRDGEGVREGRYPGTGQHWPPTGGGKGGLGDRPRTGRRVEYHHDQWTPPPTRPAVVLDPLGGTGTTALVAAALGRTGITVDRSADYCRIAAWRTTDPGQIAKAMGVPKPPQPMTGQSDMFADITP